MIRSARPDELPALAAIQTAAHAADGVEHVGSVEQLAHAVAHPRGLPVDDVLLTAVVDGRCVGFVELGSFQEPGGLHVYRHRGHVHPDWRRRRLGTALLAAAQARLERAARPQEADEAVFGAWYYDREGGAADLLRRQGYRVHRRMLQLVRPLVPGDGPVHLPAGVELRPVAPAHLRPIWNAYVTSALDDEGAVAPTPEQFAAWAALPQWDLDLWQVAWAGDQVVGLVLNNVDAPGNDLMRRLWGYTEYVGVVRAWRGRGLARALLRKSLAQLRIAGLTEAALDVNEHNEAALRLYRGLGYTNRSRLSVARRPCG